MSATADLCDSHEHLIANGELRILSPIFQTYGAEKKFSGKIKTLKLFEDNVLVKTTLQTQGNGNILCIDGGGSLRSALFGGNLAVLAEKNGWSGLIVNGCIRDVDEVNACKIGVRALGTHPKRSVKRGVGDLNVPIHLGGEWIKPDEWCYVDNDGIIVSTTRLVDPPQL